jgi:hypothetical protein
MPAEILKIHGYVTLDELDAEQMKGDEIRRMNKVLPGDMFAVYDGGSGSGAGIYTVEYKEVSEYTEA